MRSIRWYVPSFSPFSASASLVRCQPNTCRSVSVSASCCPARTVPPSGAVAGRSATTIATGMRFRFPYGSQNAHRYSAP